MLGKVWKTMDNGFEWISLSELARRIGKTYQTAFNYAVKDGRYETMEFTRGKMRGWMVKVAKE